MRRNLRPPNGLRNEDIPTPHYTPWQKLRIAVGVWSSLVLNDRGDNRRPGITWGQYIGRDECPYMRRWVLNFGRGSLRLHHWYRGDDPRHMHDHPWPFVTLVLKGGYTDVSTPYPDARWLIEVERCGVCRGVPGVVCDYCGNGLRTTCDHLSRGSIRARSALHVHTVDVDPGGCWTIMLTGRHMRDWGFWVDGTWKRMRRYFKDHGHHPCQP